VVTITVSQAISQRARLSFELGDAWPSVTELQHLLTAEFRAEAEHVLKELLSPVATCERASERMRALRDELAPPTKRSGDK
jgi:hypothetical protein